MNVSLTESGTGRRVKVLMISAEALLETLKGFDGTLERGVVTQHGIPEDVRVVGVDADMTMNMLLVYVESEEFPEVPSFQIPATLSVNFSVVVSPKLTAALVAVLTEIGT